jgi:5-formyltetrahydrofolate cyclo-ligase
LTKGQIRSRILLKLKAQKEEDRSRKSKIIKEKLFRTKVFKKAKRVMFYISFDGEVDTQEMIKQAQKLGKIIAVPVCRKKRITIRPCLFRGNPTMKRGPYGICEPAMKRFLNVKDIDLVIVPGVAFDRRGNRLGRGKGCYDEFLKTLSPDTASIGLAFDFQILPDIPATETDVNVRRVLFA